MNQTVTHTHTHTHTHTTSIFGNLVVACSGNTGDIHYQEPDRLSRSYGCVKSRRHFCRTFVVVDVVVVVVGCFWAFLHLRLCQGYNCTAATWAASWLQAAELVPNEEEMNIIYIYIYNNRLQYNCPKGEDGIREFRSSPPVG